MKTVWHHHNVRNMQSHTIRSVVLNQNTAFLLKIYQVLPLVVEIINQICAGQPTPQTQNLGDSRLERTHSVQVLYDFYYKYCSITSTSHNLCLKFFIISTDLLMKTLKISEIFYCSKSPLPADFRGKGMSVGSEIPAK